MEIIHLILLRPKYWNIWFNHCTSPVLLCDYSALHSAQCTQYKEHSVLCTVLCTVNCVHCGIGTKVDDRNTCWSIDKYLHTVTRAWVASVTLITPPFQEGGTPEACASPQYPHHVTMSLSLSLSNLSFHPPHGTQTACSKDTTSSCRCKFSVRGSLRVRSVPSSPCLTP